jgi:hypothetical protein
MHAEGAHFYRGRESPPPLKKLSPPDANLHMLQSHFEMLLWKEADQSDPHEEARYIANFG